MLLWILIGATGIMIAMMAYLYFNQEQIIFLPRADFELTPEDVGLSYEELSLLVDDEVTIHGWYFPSGNDGPTVLFCHGNAGNISHRLETAEFLTSLGANVLLFDYRGYGKSTGQPTEVGLYADAHACFDWLVKEKNIPPEQIVLFGRSLGGAVAVELATRKTGRGLIVESAFTSVADMARNIYLWLPIKFLIKHKLATIDNISKVKIPVLVMHSQADEIIPYAMGEQLYEAITAPKKFMEITGDHNSLEYYRSSKYRDNLLWILKGADN